MIIPMNKTKLSESDLIGSTLLILAKADEANMGPLKTTQIKDVLNKTVPLTEADKAILKNRKDSAFTQIVRNFTSHNTLERTGLAKRYTKLNNEDGLSGYEITNKGKAHLLNMLMLSTETPNPLLPASQQVPKQKVPTNRPQYAEQDLVEAALFVLAKAQQLGSKTITTTKLKACLEDLLPLSFADLNPLKNRSDYVFTQIVRNFTSHNTLERTGLAKRYTKVNNDAGLEGWQITMAGKVSLLKTMLSMVNDPTIRSVEEIKAESNPQTKKTPHP